MTALLLAALLLAPPAPAPAGDPPPPATEEELRDRLGAALGAIDRPVPPGAWRSLGPEAIPHLERIALDPAALPSRRARAVEGLSHLGQGGLATVLALASDEGAPFPVRAAALEAAPRLVPAARLAGVVRPALEKAADLRVRAVAAEVLASGGGCAAVRARLAHEPPAARPAFHRALARCGGDR